MLERKLKNNLFLQALNGEAVPRTPVWMMRQAGRYLPQYRSLKEKYSFFERCKTPELACEITLQPVEILDVDAAILFSDILVVPQAMGMEVQLIENKGPFLPNPIHSEKDLQRLILPNTEEALGYVMQAIELIQQSLNGKVPLIGFAGAPWTLLCYMVQGKGSKTFDEARSFCFTQPQLAHQLLQMITDATIQYTKAQIKAGVDAIQIFDSWAGLLSPSDFSVFSLPYLQQIATALNNDIPLIIFAKGAWHGLQILSTTGAKGLGIDWCITPEQARSFAGNNITLQGNLDPAKLLAPISTIQQEVKTMLHAFGKNRYIANLGHGMLPNVPVEHVKAFVNTVKEESSKMNHS